MEIWRGLSKDDVVIALGFDAGEYSLNLAKIPAGHVYHFTDMREAYGHKNGEFRHRVAHEYRQVRGDIGLVLEEVLPRLAESCTERPNTAPAPKSLNTREPEKNKRPGTVDFQEFYEIVDKQREVINPEYDKKNSHSKRPQIDFVKHAEAHGWDAVRIAPDLSNLKDTMDAAYERTGRSMLIDLPVDADQVLGLNPRLNNLTTKTYL